ncbi:MAG: SDR family NAD(P)-dependent oxidoreductase [Pirellulaceae bacterium]
MSAHPWKSKTAIVCGASDGLGREFARQLCQQSVGTLVLLARGNQRLQATCDQLRSEFPNISISTFAVDMSCTDAVGDLAAELAKTHTAVDLVIQAVGKSDRGTIRDLTKSSLLEQFDANLFPSLNAIKVLTSVVRQPGGVVVLVGSLASHFAPRFLGGYAVAKHAVAALAQQARLELEESGIHVMLASPGPIARADAGSRYNAYLADKSLPVDAVKPGGGARLEGLDAARLASDILQAATRRKPLCIYPRKARWLYILSAISPTLGDRLLRKNTS